MGTLLTATKTQLIKLNAQGKALWSRDATSGMQNTVFGVTAVPGSGVIYGWSSGINPGGWVPSVWRRSSEGGPETVMEIGSDMHQVGPLAVNAHGTVAWVSSSPGARELVVRRPGAAGDQRLDPAPGTGLGFQSVGLDDAGHIVAGAFCPNPITVGATAVPRGFSLTRFGANGALEWATSVGQDAQGFFRNLETTDVGTVVALGHFSGAVTWGSASFGGLNNDSLVFVAEANGQPRFALELPGAAGDSFLGVDPSGRLVVAWRSATGTTIRFYNLIGELLWERTLTGDVTPTGAAFLGHDVVISGRFSGAADFGSGVQFAEGEDGFLLRLAP